MGSASARPAAWITFTAPVIFLVLAATAIPIELRPLREAHLNFAFDDIPDIVTNVLGYVPVGIVLGAFGPLKAILIGGLISAFAETGQFVMAHRDPSFTDVVANVAGAALGAFAIARSGIRVPALRINRWKALLAALLSAALVLYLWEGSGEPVNARGLTSPGTLEALWKLNESGGRAMLDSSGHGLTGTFRREPKRNDGGQDTAPIFDGTNYGVVSSSTDLRLAGSMTISAWINSTAYPFDDAAIVSQLGERRGFQLDTTSDKGVRGIGFKLTDACGSLMARYGDTPLALNTWYHLAGVYDAAARTLNVYLNGKLDNGYLDGSVTSMQRSSRGGVYVGRRGDSRFFNFSGLMRDVRIYSFALDEHQIAADQRGEAIEAPPLQPAAATRACGALSDPDDKELPGAAATLGVLVAIACLGFWPSAGWPALLGGSLAAGVIVLAVSASNLPAFNTWMLPLVSVAGGISVAASVRRSQDAIS